MPPDRWGIESEYRDAFGERRRVDPAVHRRVVEAMGVTPDERAPRRAPVRVARPGAVLEGPGRVVLEDGADLGLVDRLPPDVPLGYHELEVDGDRVRLIVGPGACHLPAGLRAWGWAVQLYATRSTASWGIGDLVDLRALGSWSADLGARYLLVNPLSAPSPVLPQEPSPYFPSTRRFRNLLELGIMEVPGAAAAGAELEPLAALGRALDAERAIDRDAAYRLKVSALEAIWRHGPPRAGLDAYRRHQGDGLREWTTFAAIAEQLGPAWRSWPEELRRPDAPGVARFAYENEPRLEFHEWVQWLIDEQLGSAAEHIGLVADMPIGVDREGADAWAWQDQMALDVSIGAPPDRFNRVGQAWGLPPFIPHRLREDRHEPFIQTVRACLRHAAGLRIDHVMGLFRQWWIPPGNGPEEGAYVRYPSYELLEIVAIESVRAGALVIGEDLGTVEPGVRDELARRRVLSSRLVYFEEGGPASFPELSFGAITTHDLPTIAGAWRGSDLDDQARSGLEPDAAGLAILRHRLATAVGLPAEADVDEVVLRAHAALAASPSMLVSGTLEDALRVEERPNVPGTTTTRANWSRALPTTLEEIRRDPFGARVARALARGR